MQKQNVGNVAGASVGGVPNSKATAHTPGPWVVQRDYGLRQRIQTAGDKGTICYMTARPFAHGANFSHGQITANARLIAAAPELLEVVHCLLVAREHETGNTICDENSPLIDAARLAFAKATGAA